MAGFNTAVTGLKSSSTLLDVAGNNIANSSTVGYKASRTEFADIYATSVVGAGSSNLPGSGVTVMDISQDFSAGTIEFTNNNLDLAINGSGFFQLNDGNGGVTYTRAGAFELDKDGYIVSKNGKFLQGYGLDALGNQLPLQNLAVTQKESAPHATENIDLSFNIDSTANAELLSRSFDKTNAASYTYSTTVETVDSLGNSNSIRFYTVEQAAVREGYTYDLTGLDTLDGAGNPGQDGLPDEDLLISGFTIPQAAFPDIQGYLAANPTVATNLAVQDPRIDLSTLAYNSGTHQLTFELKAEYTQSGNIVVTGAAGTETPIIGVGASERAANEVQMLPLSVATTLGTPTTVTIGGVDIALDASSDVDDVGAAIAAAERDIIAKNPDIQSVEYDTTTKNITITWKAEVGNVDPISVSPAAGSEPIAAAGLSTLYNGDNSYQGAYRLYAYLNDETALDIGKVVDPGEAGFASAATEVGPILINFDPTTGVLSGVNGDSIPNGAAAPRITILGADPANPNDQVLDTDLDGLAGIQLDITGSSQFASESIVKSSSQNGYPKGDLIGVTFAETGEMVASFSNGQRQNLGLVAIATFENQSGLQPSGDTEWISTLNSGTAILNPPGTGLNGTLRSAALEQSNVDLSAELVKLIEGQRNFQANSKTLSTLNTVTQAILQI